MRVRCSALSVLASSSGVASERAAFMGLVRNEIDRLNAELVNRGSVSMIFQRGNVKVRPARVICGRWLVEECARCTGAVAGRCIGAVSVARTSLGKGCSSKLCATGSGGLHISGVQCVVYACKLRVFFGRGCCTPV